MRLGENNFKKFQALNNRQHYDLEIHSVYTVCIPEKSTEN